MFPSPNRDARTLPVSLLVLHYTGMPTADAARARLCDPDARVSAHYLVDEDGTIHALVDEAERAWHAGVSYWQGIFDVNSASIGIELVNPGHECGYRPFPAAQIGALIDLGARIRARHPAILPWGVVGHSDIAPVRKRDPGELFPWRELAAASLGLWPAPGAMADDGRPFAALLSMYGYDVRDEAAAVTAFHRHFHPERLGQDADGESRRRLLSLLAQKHSLV